MGMKYLIEIEKVRDDGDFEGNGVPSDLIGLTAHQLQKAIAYDLVRIRSAEGVPFQTKPKWTWDQDSYPNHRPEFG